MSNYQNEQQHSSKFLIILFKNSHLHTTELLNKVLTFLSKIISQNRFPSQIVLKKSIVKFLKIITKINFFPEN